MKLSVIEGKGHSKNLPTIGLNKVGREMGEGQFSTNISIEIALLQIVFPIYF